MKLTKLLLLVAASLFLGARADAQLKWEQTELELHPSVADENAVAHFKYQNVGFTTIHFNAVRTSCGCTVAKMEKDDVAPGEKGEITATLKIGDRTGLQQKAVTVETNDPKSPTTTLMLKAMIPKLLEVQPPLVSWDAKEPLKAKDITVHALAESPVTKLTVTSTDPAVTTTVTPGPTAKDWIISVRPTDRKQLHSAMLTIRPDFPPNAPKLFYAAARIASTPAETQ